MPYALSDAPTLTIPTTTLSKTLYPFLDLECENNPLLSQIRQAMLRVIESGRYIGGEECTAFERELAAKCGISHAVGTGNGLDALTLILQAYIAEGRLREGDKVLLPSLTFIATGLAVTRARLTPVFGDVDPRTGLLSADETAGLIADDPQIKAVIPVHLYGRCCLNESLSQAKRSGILVIEDAAQAIGATAASDHAVKAGSIGHAAATSFYPTKNLGAMGDGGAVLTDDPRLAQLIRSLANYGRTADDVFMPCGVNSRLDPLQAAILRVKQSHLDEVTARRRAIAQVYSTNITNPAITLPAPDSGSVWHQYVVCTENRDRFREYLETNGVQTMVHYPYELHMLPQFSRYATRRLPVAEALSRHVVSLPIGLPTTPETALEIAQIINSYEP